MRPAEYRPKDDVPASRKRPDRTQVPARIADICDAVIDVLERSKLTNLEVLARSGLPISKTTLSRRLLGQGRESPSPELVTALLEVVAGELAVDPSVLYAEYPVLARYAPAVAAPAMEASFDDEREEQFMEKVGWLWAQIIEGREHAAAIALHGTFLTPEAREAAFRYLCFRDIGGAAALMRATEELHGPEAATALIGEPDGFPDRGMRESDTTHYRRLEEPLWNAEHRRDMEDFDRGPELVGRRLSALIARGDVDQARHEFFRIAGQTPDDGSVALAVLYGIIRSAQGFLRYDRALAILNSAVSAAPGSPVLPDDERVDYSGNGPLLHVIYSALLVDARATGTVGLHKKLITGLEPPVFDTLLCRFSTRDRVSRPAGRADLVDFLTAAAREQLSVAIPLLDPAGLDEHSFCAFDHIADVLLATDGSRLRQIATDEPAAVAAFILRAFLQTEKHWYDDQRDDLLFRLIVFMRSAPRQVFEAAAETWHLSAIEALARGMVSSWSLSAPARAAEPLAILVTAVNPDLRARVAEVVFSATEAADPKHQQTLQTWIEVIAESAPVAETLLPSLAVHERMLEFVWLGSTDKYSHEGQAGIAFQAGMDAVRRSDFATASTIFRKRPAALLNRVARGIEEGGTAAGTPARRPWSWINTRKPRTTSSDE
ncbi:hypothetical protein [Nocardia sp. NPDC050435]|uniref:hypothetical protein n=1 Tax=Nocardia sp. NPDC050435 TaxID=3155040 RepID=UPI0033D2CBE1